MFDHRLDTSPGFRVFSHWFLLSFNAGCINSGGILAGGRFVSHVTGFATLFGVHAAHGEWEAAFGILSVPLSFLAGATISGMLIDRQIHLHRKPHYDYVMLMSAVCLGLSALAGGMETLPAFGQDFHLKQTYILLVLLCLACGLQNAAISTSSGKSVRTTHLTGITTDLGLGIARRITLKRNPVLLKREQEANIFRIGTIISFALGSAVSALLFLRFKYYGFLLPCAIALYAALHGRHVKLTHDRFRRADVL